MTTQLQVLRQAVTDALGRDDATAKDVAERGINFAQLLAAILFQPAELQVSGSLSVSGASTSLASLTGLWTIFHIDNLTTGKPVGLIPRNRWYHILPETPSGTVYIEYASRFGSTLYVKHTPTGANILAVLYLKYPSTLVSDTDTLDFDYHDSWITATATRYAFACFEEQESSDLFKAIGDGIGIPLNLGSQLRAVLEEGLKLNGNNTQGNNS